MDVPGGFTVCKLIGYPKSVPPIFVVRVPLNHSSLPSGLKYISLLGNLSVELDGKINCK
jgi:hypothetical protein